MAELTHETVKRLHERIIEMRSDDLMLWTHTEYDAVKLGEQRPGVSTGALVGAANGLIIEAVCAAAIWLGWEALKMFMR